ncbi:MAG TPA: GntR family transcriptional regulator [Geminicoccus sp.]|uniref:GntR family transcriptional regulator n=1 Tax=Geminicoccus sp. TaxID=2024832 RepID=UPI002B6BDBE6|nr:GntR family transcriptional regulator [Geminicoccus sp.]HWL67197.1 GntR family transcriptional regulator [Geminicoccus sp.]
MTAPVLPDEPGEAPATARERSDRIYGILRDRICMLAYPPGTRLSEEELALEFNVSRTPVRRVLTRLENEGLVSIVHGVGTLVTDVDLDELAQVYHLRLELAALMGRLAPVQPDADAIGRIEALIERCDEQAASRLDHMAFARLNMAFFAEISAMIGNQPLREISERLYYQTSRIVLKLLPTMNLQEEFSAFRQEMVEILAAVRLGDIVSVGHLRRVHISMSFQRMLRRADAARR